MTVSMKSKRSAAALPTAVFIVGMAWTLLLASLACSTPVVAPDDLDGVEAVIFAVRQPRGPHWYENMGYSIADVNDKAVPGTESLVMINSPKHGRSEHQGRLALVQTNLGPDRAEAQTLIHRDAKFRDPYALSSDAILVAQGTKLLMMNSRGRSRELYALCADLAREGAWLHEPRPLQSRKREPVIPARTDRTQSMGQLIVQDIYRGRNMKGIPPGAIKKLLILENLPKPVNFTGSMDPISYGGSYTLNRAPGPPVPR